MEKTEEVKKILKTYDVLRLTGDGMAKEICQLFPKSVDNLDGYEPNITDGSYRDWTRLLTMVERSTAITERRRILELNGHKPTTQDDRYAVALAQLAKDIQWEAEFLPIKDAECQARVEKIKKWVEDNLLPYAYDGSPDRLRWQEFWKQEGIK